MSKSVNSFTINTHETFGRAVFNPLNRFTFVHAAIVNISVLTDGEKMPSGFAMCFKPVLVDHTTDPDSLLHDGVLSLDHHAVGHVLSIS